MHTATGQLLISRHTCTAMEVRRRWPLKRPGGALGKPPTHTTTQPLNRSVSNSMRLRSPMPQRMPHQGSQSLAVLLMRIKQCAPL